MNKSIYIIILFLTVQVYAVGQVKLSLETCRSLALENSEDIKIAQKKIQKAEAEKKAAFTNYLPNVSGSTMMAYKPEDVESELYLPTAVPDQASGELVPNVMMNPMTNEPVMDASGNPVFNMYAFLPIEISLKGAYIAGVSVEQALYAGGKINAGNKMARIGRSMADENLELNRANTLAEADQAYWLHISVKEKETLVNQSVSMLKEILNSVQNGYDAGMINRNELLKVQVQYNQATLDLQKVRSGLELTRMSLCRIIGLDLDTAIDVVDTTINLTDYASHGNKPIDVVNRPEYKLLEQAVSFENENVKLVRGDFLPTAGISAGYTYLGGIEMNGNEITNNGVNVIASVSIPIFHWGEGKHKLESAKLDREIKVLNLKKNSQLMLLEIQQAKLNMVDAYSRIELAEMALAQADENLKYNKDNYELGMGLMTDLLIAQTSWKQAYSEVIDAKTDYKIKETFYLKAIGSL